MKLQNLILLLTLIVPLLLIGSCVKLSDEVTSTPHLNGITLASALTSTPTYMPLPSPTPNIIPTLSVEEARISMVNLLAGNRNCLLPCLWGIIPGESSFQDVRAILMPLSSLSSETHLSQPESGGINLRYIEGDLEIDIVIGFFMGPDSGRVSRIVFNASAQKKIEGGFQDVFNSTFFNERVGYYMLPNILATYGPPSDVLLLASANIPPQQPWWPFQIIVSYPEQGMLVQYTTPMNVDDLNSVGCPIKSQIEIQLVPAGSINTTAEFLMSNNYSNINLLKPIEEVTSLSVDEFFETFNQPTERCIETPSKYWPPSF